MQKQFEIMLSLQDKMNSKVHADWIDQGFEWYRALWIECGELMDHQGYKWWKKQLADIEQVQLEIVDIWHFGLSMLIDERRDFVGIAAAMCESLQQRQVQNTSVLLATEALAADTLVRKQFSVPLFWDLLESAEMGADQLYTAYIGKNVLNFFRQDHGYKTGTYIKQWQGREDNEHLSEIVTGLDCHADNFADQLYLALAERYQALCGNGD